MMTRSLLPWASLVHSPVTLDDELGLLIFSCYWYGVRTGSGILDSRIRTGGSAILDGGCSSISR